MFDYNSIERRMTIFMREWRTIQSTSLKAVNAILALVSKLALIKQKQFYEDLERFSGLEDRLAMIIIDQMNMRFPEMQSSFDDFKKLLERISNWNEVCTRLINSEMKSVFAKNIQLKSDIIDEIRSMEQLLEQIQEIILMFETEVKLREQILLQLKQSLKQLNPQLISFYLTIWASEPYVDFNRINEILESFQESSFQENDLKSQI